MLVGVCQTDIFFEDVRYNLIAVQDYIAKCAKQGAKLALFPEFAFTGETLEPKKIFEVYSDIDIVSEMSKLACRYGIAVGFGYISNEDGYFSNRYAVVDKSGKILSDYSKIHPFSFLGEDRVYEPGECVVTYEIEGVRLSSFICYDLRFPEIFRAVAKDVDAIIVAANWPAQRSSHWRILLQARALENQCSVIGINRVGNDDSSIYMGDSMLVNPMGEIVDVMDDNAGIMLIEVNPEETKNFREKFPALADMKYKIPGVFTADYDI